MNIMAIDPGVMTGFAYARLSDTGKIEFLPFQAMDAVDDLWRRLEQFKPKYIIMENFEFRGRASTGLNLFPVQLIGVASLYELIEPTGQCVLKLQSAATGKSYYTDNMLKQMKLYKRGIPHGMDATRHLLQWLTFGAGYQFVNGTRDFAVMLDTWKDS